ncbi:MAG: DUF4124 domain-containing protein, partial [Methylophilus sp.]
MNTFYMNNIKFSPIFLLTLMLFSFSNESFANIYRWKDSKGVMHYSDRPPSAITRKHSEDILLKVIRDQDLCAAPIKNNSKAYDPITLNSLLSTTYNKLSSTPSISTTTSPTTTTTTTTSPTTTTTTTTSLTTTTTSPTTTTTSPTTTTT